MRALLIAFVIAGTSASPAVAQTSADAEQAPAKAEYVEKVVCQKVEEEQSTGSRLGSTTKICKTVKVPLAEADKDKKANPRAY